MSETMLHPDAHALRCVRFFGDDVRKYEAVTFPRDPWSGCERTLRILRACGYLKRDDDPTLPLIDVLNEDGSIVQDFPVTRDGFEYLRRTLKFRVDRSSEQECAEWMERASLLPAARPDGEA